MVEIVIKGVILNSGQIFTLAIYFLEIETGKDQFASKEIINKAKSLGLINHDQALNVWRTKPIWQKHFPENPFYIVVHSNKNNPYYKISETGRGWLKTKQAKTIIVHCQETNNL